MTTIDLSTQTNAPYRKRSKMIFNVEYRDSSPTNAVRQIELATMEDLIEFCIAVGRFEFVKPGGHYDNGQVYHGKNTLLYFQSEYD